MYLEYVIDTTKYVSFETFRGDSGQRLIILQYVKDGRRPETENASTYIYVLFTKELGTIMPLVLAIQIICIPLDNLTVYMQKQT